MMSLPVEFVVTNPRLVELGGTPQPATKGAAAVDLRACIDEQVTIEPGQSYKFDLGFAIHVRDLNVAALILPRSGLGSRGLILANVIGLIDSDYTGGLSAVALNRNGPGGETFVINPGDRIFQMMFVPIVLANFVQVEAFSMKTERGCGGYGSTGL